LVFLQSNLCHQIHVRALETLLVYISCQTRLVTSMFLAIR